MLAFSDFVESVVETPICCELKQHLDKLHEFYAKDPEKCVFHCKPSRGSTKNNLLMIFLLSLLEMYERHEK